MTEYLSILTDPAHVAAEATFVLIEVAIARPIFRAWLKRHDARHHSEEEK